MKDIQNKKYAKPKFNKDEVNRKSSIIFTQLGLVFALLLTYLAIESKTLIKDDIAKFGPVTIFGIEEEAIPDTTPEKPKQEEVKVKPEPKIILDNVKIIDDNDPDIESFIDSDDFDDEKPVDLDNFDDEIIIPEDDPEDVPFTIIEEAPIFPGCSGTKEERKQCFSKSVTKLVSRKFNGDLAQELGLASGKKRISVQFTVDKQGNISDVLVRAPHKRLEKEARRVVSLLPKMIPGKQRNNPVGVKFTLPITFIIE
jgi:protein TonB